MADFDIYSVVLTDIFQWGWFNHQKIPKTILSSGMFVSTTKLPAIQHPGGKGICVFHSYRSKIYQVEIHSLKLTWHFQHLRLDPWFQEIPIGNPSIFKVHNVSFKEGIGLFEQVVVLFGKVCVLCCFLVKFGPHVLLNWLCFSTFEWFLLLAPDALDEGNLASNSFLHLLCRCVIPI